MSLLNIKIRKPLLALAIFFFLGFILSEYGYEQGAAMIIALVAGIFIYKFILGQTHW